MDLSEGRGVSQHEMAAHPQEPLVAVLIPCYNEEATIATVVERFRSELPRADIYVYDNNSTDDSVARARSAGAHVRRVPLQGKGHVVRRMFADIDADAYLLVDGDDTYDPAGARRLIEAVLIEGYDLANGTRIPEHPYAIRRGHGVGNRALTVLVERLFGRKISDMLSGYKALSRRFVKSFPAFSNGFEIETELTVHALGVGMPIANIPLAYRERPEGSVSKLKTFGDGFKILRTITGLVRQERPLAFFSAISIFLGVVAVILAIPLVTTYIHIHKVPRFPTAIVVTGLILLASLSAVCGLVLDTVTRGRREMRVFTYLSIPGPIRHAAGRPIANQWIGKGSGAYEGTEREFLSHIE